MAVDPEISLNIKTPDNPLVLAGQISQSMATMNGMQARQRLGQIVSSAPTLEAGMAQAAQDPLVAAYGGEAMNSMRQMMLAQTQQAGEQQKQYMDGWDRMNKVFGSFPGDPGKAQQMMGGLFAGVNPQVRGALVNAFQNANMALYTDNRGNLLPHNDDGTLTDAGKQQYFQNSAGMAIAGGMTPDQFAITGGKPGQVDLGPVIQPTRTLASGQVIKVGDPIPKGIAPTVSPEGFVRPGVRAEDMPGQPGAAGRQPPAGQTQAPPAAPQTYQTATGTRPLLPPGQATSEQILDFGRRESNLQNIESKPDPKTGKKSSASGYFQMTDDTWKEGAQAVGIDVNKYPRAIDDPSFTDQYRAAEAIFNRRGEAPWQSSIANSRLPIPGPRGGVGGGPSAPAAPQAAQDQTQTQGPIGGQAPMAATPSAAGGQTALTTPTPTPAQGSLGQRGAPAQTATAVAPASRAGSPAPTATAPTPLPPDNRPKWLQDRTPPGTAIAPPPAALSGPAVGDIAGPPGQSGVDDRIAGDGKPTWTNQTAFKGLPKVPSNEYDAAGNQIMKFKDPDLAKSENTNAEKWKVDTAGFESAQNSLRDLRVMRNDLDDMMSKGWFQPGALAESRVEFAKYANTAAALLGQNPPFKPGAAASAEQFIKTMNEMGVAMGRSLLGGQKEAAQTIQQVTRSVPGVENTYLGARMIMAGMESVFQRQIDERNYTNEFLFRNGGDTITGAKEQFNNEHPIQGYVDHALAPFGIANGRIQSVDDAAWLYQNGYINQPEYRTARNEIRARGQ